MRPQQGQNSAGRKQTPSLATASAGFTLTELITVLLIIAILAVFVLPRFTGMNVIQERTEYDKVVSALSYARKTAIAQRRYACVSLSASSISLTTDANPPESTAAPFGGTCPFATAMRLPSPDASCPAGNQVCLKSTTIASTPSVFQFDPLGRASAVVTVTVSGFPPIKVEGETGHIH